MPEPTQDAETRVEAALDAMHHASAANRVTVWGQHQNVRKMLREILEAVAALRPTEPTPPTDTEWVREVVERVAELPDRTSPDDWPEAMLVTGDELEGIIADVLASRVPPTPEQGRVELVAWGRKLDDYPIATSFLQHTEQAARDAIAHLPWPGNESTPIALYTIEKQPPRTERIDLGDGV